MSPRTDYEAFESSSAENRRLLRQEELILEVTEALASALSREDVTKAQLAERLGKSKAFVSQILAGGRNLTLRTVADVANALGYRIKVAACKEDRIRIRQVQEFKVSAMPKRVPWVVEGRFGKASRGIAA
jgi:transcriptional regulator with XRE-family HTH domain